jgi:hypothetical protein
VLLTIGNTPGMGRGFVTPSLYWVVVPAAFADMLVALHIRLSRARKQQEHPGARCAAAPAPAASPVPHPGAPFAALA